MGYGVGGGGSGWGSVGVGSYGTIGYGRGGVRERRVAVPTVTLAQPTIAYGDLDKSIIRRYIHRHLDKVRYCYEKALLGKPTLEGIVASQFVIGPDGRVTVSTASGVDPAVSSCVASVIKDIEFPRPENNGGTVQVNYPFTFHSNVIREENR
jgi:hypothetical protein